MAATFLDFAVNMVQRFEATLFLPLIKLVATIFVPGVEEMNRGDDSMYTLARRNMTIDKLLDNPGMRACLCVTAYPGMTWQA